MQAMTMIQVMIMKMHSYMSTNGELDLVNRKSQEVHAELQKATEEVGGWEKALAAAKENKERVVAEEARDAKEAGTIAGVQIDNGAITPGGTTTSFIDAKDAANLRRRLAAAVNGEASLDGSAPTSTSSSSSSSVAEPSASSAPRSTKVETTGNRIIPPASTPLTAPSDTLVLTYHPSEKVSALARAHAELESELTSSGPARVRWPENISLRDFALYQLTPTLVYELEYPRTERCVSMS